MGARRPLYGLAHGRGEKRLQEKGWNGYTKIMTKLFEHAVETVRNLPAEVQDEIARLVLQLASDDEQSGVQLTPEEESSFDASFAEAARGEYATDEQVRAIWAKHGL